MSFLHRAVAGVAVLGVALSMGAARAEPVTAARDTTIGWTDRASFQQALQDLRPGDTLRLRPGRYDIAGMKPELAHGSAGKPIRVTAADAARPPEIRGQLVLQDADYWFLSHLRITGTVRSQPPLKMAGGNGWVVSENEITGAAETVVHANVVIDHNRTTGVAASNWRFVGNCVHDAARRPAGDGAGYHNIYMTMEGGRNGLIARNILFNAPNGSNIKIGTGSDAQRPGAQGVRIENNTMANAEEQVLLFGNLRDVVVTHNLLVGSVGTNVRAGQYLHTLGSGGRPRVVTTGNYGADMTRSTFTLNTPTSSVVDQGNVLGKDPRMQTATCSQFVPADPVAARYGRWAPAG